VRLIGVVEQIQEKPAIFNCRRPIVDTAGVDTAGNIDWRQFSQRFVPDSQFAHGPFP
jgi:hypothetical protein